SNELRASPTYLFFREHTYLRAFRARGILRQISSTADVGRIASLRKCTVASSHPSFRATHSNRSSSADLLRSRLMAQHNLYFGRTSATYTVVNSSICISSRNIIAFIVHRLQK